MVNFDAIGRTGVARPPLGRNISAVIPRCYARIMPVTAPQACPVCGSHKIYTNVGNRFVGERRSPPGFVRFSCDKGHVFYMKRDAEPAKPTPAKSEERRVGKE